MNGALVYSNEEFMLLSLLWLWLLLRWCTTVCSSYYLLSRSDNQGLNTNCRKHEHRL